MSDCHTQALTIWLHCVPLICVIAFVLINFLFCFLAVSRLDGRAMSPAQSEDSGLAADRGSTYATISIPRQNCQSMGIIFAGKIYAIFVPLLMSSPSSVVEPLFPLVAVFRLKIIKLKTNFRHISLRCKKSCWRDVKLISRN